MMKDLIKKVFPFGPKLIDGICGGGNFGKGIRMDGIRGREILMGEFGGWEFEGLEFEFEVFGPPKWISLV